ncbi:hypothetical protein AC1031_015272 [Aphanomyces cochlioides]|nr:hypothetical protein AC1031_015272 [Aphanomyces cochlioides]
MSKAALLVKRAVVPQHFAFRFHRGVKERTMSPLDDAYAAYQVGIARRQEASRRRIGRIGRKRQIERKASEDHLRMCEQQARLEMHEEDELSKALQRAILAELAAAAYADEQRLCLELTKARKQAHAFHLDIQGGRGQDRLKKLQKRIHDHNERAQLAAEATQHLAAYSSQRKRIRDDIAVASKAWWRAKLDAALKALDATLVVALVEKGADPNHESPCGLTPLLSCLAVQRQDLLRRCLELGADPNLETSAGQTALLVAVVANDMVAINVLLERQWKCSPWFETSHGGVTALLVASEKGRVEMLERLLALPGASVHINRSNAVHGLTALMQAAVSNQFAAARLLLRHGANPYLSSHAKLTAADMARRRGFHRMASLCTRGNDNNLDPSTPQTFEECTEMTELKAVHVAMSDALANDRVDELIRLIDDCDVVCPDYESPSGRMGFLVACAVGTIAQVSQLIARCRSTLPNRFGTTGLLQAAARGRFDVLMLLARHGANLQMRDFHGRDVFRMLRANGHDDILDYVSKYKTTDGILPWWTLDLPAAHRQVPQADAASAAGMSPKKSPLKPLSLRLQLRPMCDQCESRHATKVCTSCRVPFCDQCFWVFHVDARRRQHAYELVASASIPEADSTPYSFDGLLSRSTCGGKKPNQEVERQQRLNLQRLDAAQLDQAHQDTTTATTHAIQDYRVRDDTSAGDPLFSAPSEVELAKVYRAEGKLEEAMAQLQDAQAMIEKEVGAAHAAVARVKLEKSRVFRDQRKLMEATECAQEALLVFLKRHAVDDEIIAETLSELYSILDIERPVDGAVVGAQWIARVIQRSCRRQHPLRKTCLDKVDQYKARLERNQMTEEDHVARRMQPTSL